MCIECNEIHVATSQILALVSLAVWEPWLNEGMQIANLPKQIQLTEQQDNGNQIHR